jgi:hypothetical protein
MPASFCFKKSDGTNEMLDDIDNKIAVFLDKTPSEEYNSYMDFISEMGFEILLHTDGCSIDETKFNIWLADASTIEPTRFNSIIQSFDGKLLLCLRKFLYQDYTFTAWR